MNEYLRELGSLKSQFREGGDPGQIIGRVMEMTEVAPSNGQEIFDKLAELKARLENIAECWVKGTISRDAYTLEWGDIVRGTIKVIEQMQKEATDSV